MSAERRHDRLPSPEELAETLTSPIEEQGGCGCCGFEVEMRAAIGDDCPADDHTHEGECIYAGDLYGHDLLVAFLAKVVAARDEAVRADERARVLADFEWEADDCSLEFRTHGRNCTCFGPPYGGPKVGRWVGPWEPVDGDHVSQTTGPDDADVERIARKVVAVREAVRAEERARATPTDDALIAELVGRGVLEEERVARVVGPRDMARVVGPCAAEVHADLEQPHEMTTECFFPHAKVSRRYVSKWEEVVRDA